MYDEDETLNHKVVLETNEKLHMKINQIKVDRLVMIGEYSAFFLKLFPLVAASREMGQWDTHAILSSVGNMMLTLQKIKLGISEMTLHLEMNS